MRQIILSILFVALSLSLGFGLGSIFPRKVEYKSNEGLQQLINDETTYIIGEFQELGYIVKSAPYKELTSDIWILLVSSKKRFLWLAGTYEVSNLCLSWEYGTLDIPTFWFVTEIDGENWVIAWHPPI